MVNQIGDGARHDVFVGEFRTVYWPGCRETRMPLLRIFAPMRSKASLWISGQVECVDRTRTERDQIRTDAEQLDVVLAVVVDHLLQRGQIVRGHLRQFLRGRVPLHDAADICVGCADVEAGVADGHRGPPFVQSSRWNSITALHIWISSRIFCGNPSATHRTSGCRWLRWRHRRDFSLCRSIRRRRFG